MKAFEPYNSPEKRAVRRELQRLSPGNRFRLMAGMGLLPDFLPEEPRHRVTILRKDGLRRVMIRRPDGTLAYGLR